MVFLKACTIPLDEIWLLGSETDKSGVDTVLIKHLSDHRGDLSLTEIIQFFERDEVAQVICFDNFFMHLAELYSVPSMVKFRGRMLKKNVGLHINTINVACAMGQSKITYID